MIYLALIISLVASAVAVYRILILPNDNPKFICDYTTTGYTDQEYFDLWVETLPEPKWEGSLVKDQVVSYNHNGIKRSGTITGQIGKVTSCSPILYTIKDNYSGEITQVIESEISVLNSANWDTVGGTIPLAGAVNFTPII